MKLGTTIRTSTLLLTAILQFGATSAHAGVNATLEQERQNMENDRNHHNFKVDPNQPVIKYEDSEVAREANRQMQEEKLRKSREQQEN